MRAAELIQAWDFSQIDAIMGKGHLSHGVMQQTSTQYMHYLDVCKKYFLNVNE